MTLVDGCSRAMMAVLIGLALACSSPAPPKSPKAEATRAESESAQRKVAPATGASEKDSSSQGSATAVAAPKFSADPCEKDSDCAPVAMCHPDRCAALAHVGSMPSEMMCTMECRGGTVDCGYNHCGCVPSPSGKKVCALLRGAGEKH